MTMKKRIFISNTIMVFLSLLILFCVGSIYVQIFKENIINVVKQNSELPDDTYQVCSLLKEEQNHPEIWKKLSNKLKEYDFKLYVSDSKQKKQFSNIKHREKECIEELEEDDFSYDGIKLYNMENVTIVRCFIESDNEIYSVYATHFQVEKSFFGIDFGMFETFIIVFALFGIITIIGLLFCCQIFTKLMIKRIMLPVDELNRAALRINNGNLDELVVYRYQDEFGEVCHTFNTMQAHLKEEIEKTKAYEKARTEMISGISHDLRTPLTSVKGFIKGMMDGVAKTPEKQKQYLEISYKKACDMDILLQKLFFFSKLETGNMPFFMQIVEINKWFQKYVEEKKEEGKANNYQIEIKYEPDESYVNMDCEQMKRVFDNMVENSVKYAKIKEIQMRILINKINNKVKITFSDNGIGIINEKLPHVFEQFYRGDESRNSKNDGSGLGLYVCKYIIESHHGEIKAFNKDGFCIEIDLPLCNERKD